MTINDNSTKSINAAIIDLQNQIKQLQHKIDILNKNQLKEDDIEFPGKVEYADEAGKAKEADHAKTADTAKYTSETENAVHAGYADEATKATQDASGNVITDTYATKTELTSGLSGKANTSHNHSAADITSGTLAVERGGTGQTTQAGINKAFVSELPEGNDVVTDGTEFVSSYASDNGFADTNAVNVPYKRKFSRVWEYIKGKISSVLGLTASNYGGKANTAGTADYANAPTGFVKIAETNWGNKDGEFITDWETVKSTNASNHGDIAFRFNKGQLNIIIDGVFYQNEGIYKLVDENSIKTIMKPNYTTGRFPAGKYSGGETVTISATITTTRGNPVFISYSGDFNSTNTGDTTPWISFNLYADGVLIQKTVVDNSYAIPSDNASFAGNALAVLSAGSHTIRLDAVLTGTGVGQIEFQEQENYVNLVAFEL